jgi:hypothetical protein
MKRQRDEKAIEGISGAGSRGRDSSLSVRQHPEQEQPLSGHSVFTLESASSSPSRLQAAKVEVKVGQS